MKIKKKLKNLPEVVEIDPGRAVMVGTWHFNIQEELDQPDGAHWQDARALVAFAEYLDKVRKDKQSEGE